jgi:hypothetical protein
MKNSFQHSICVPCLFVFAFYLPIVFFFPSRISLLFIFILTLISTVSQEEASAIKAAGKAWYHTMVSDSDYTEFDNFSKWLGVSQ